MNSLYFFYSNWLRSDFSWHSPYHQIAFDLSTLVRKSTAHRLLDCGLLHRAEIAYNTKPHIFTSAALAKLEYLRGNPAAAIAQLAAALTSKERLEQQRAIKLLTRLSPSELINWSERKGRPRLSQCLQAAIADDVKSAPALPNASGDEHLLNANRRTSLSEKLRHLNAYWLEMGLSPLKESGLNESLDINYLAGHSDRRHTSSASPSASVSIIMTVFNGEKYVRASVLSLLRQTDVDTEIILIDDASTDSTWEVISQLKIEYPRPLITHRLSDNVGTYAAKNFALALCSKEYVAFQDADDWSHPERLKKAVEWLALSREHVAVTSRYVRLTEEGRFFSPGVWPLRQWSPNTLVIRREIVLNAIGTFDNVRIGADTDYFERIRATFGDRRILFQKEVMLIAMSLPSSLMHNKSTGLDAFGHSAPRIAYRNLSAERILRNIVSKA